MSAGVLADGGPVRQGAAAGPSVEVLVARWRPQLANALSSGGAALPSLPSASAGCLAALRRTGCNPAILHTLLSHDDALARRVVRLAASGAAAPGGQVVNLEQALACLGPVGVKHALLEMAVRDLFEPSDPLLRDACHRGWMHSVAVAMIARHLARVLGREELADTAWLAGILHDAGMPAVAGFIAGREGEPPLEPGTLGRVASSCHRGWTTALIRPWFLAPEVLAAVAGCEEFDVVNRVTASNLVCVASALATVQGLGPCEGPAGPEAKEMASMGVKRLLLDKRDMERLVHGLDDGVATLGALLGA